MATDSNTILVVGGTGVLGRPVVQQLTRAGHRVHVLSSGPHRDPVVRQMGAEPIRASLWDPETLGRAMDGVTAVLHLATRIPDAKRMGRLSAWAENDRIRTVGTKHLVDAALAADVETFLYPSVCFTYADAGARVIDALSATIAPSRVAESTLVSEREVERFARAGRRGLVLRLGYLYGTGVPHTNETMAFARRGVAMVLGADDAYFPQIWMADAASAAVAALRNADSGTYDLVDDEPLVREEQMRLLAHAAGKQSLWRPPLWLTRLMVNREVLEIAARSQRVSNARLKAATGWSPSVRSAREGWARIQRESR